MGGSSNVRNGSKADIRGGASRPVAGPMAGRASCIAGATVALRSSRPRNWRERGAAPRIGLRVEQVELIVKMRKRVAQCRRLAETTSDPRTAAILRGMADEGDSDIRRLLGQNGPG